MKRTLLLACAALLVTSPASAQMDLALGKPLPITSMPTGKVSVRVIRGNMSSPITGVDVVLEGEGGTSKTARTDPQGRAAFEGLKVGGTYVAKTAIDDAELATDAFEVPASGGLAFLLSPVPLEGFDRPAASGAGEGAGGGDDLPPIMREPRRISGQPRPEQNDPAGSLTVRLVQGKFKKTAAGIVSEFPPGAVVTLVGFGGDEKITVDSRPVDEEGRVKFEGLRRTGTSYYALAVLDRGNGIEDRVISKPIALPPQVGMRVLLAGAARNSTEPPIDDQRQTDHRAAPGSVVVAVDATDGERAALKSATEVELFSARTGTKLATAAIAAAVLGPDDVVGTGSAIEKTGWGLSDGQAGFMVIRMSTREGQANVPVTIRETGAPDAEPLSKPTSDRGLVVFDNLQKGKEYVASTVVRGKTIDSSPFSLPDAGSLSVAFVVDWPQEGGMQARFDGLPTDPDEIYIARMKAGGREHTSPPFQLTRSAGATVGFFIAPPVLFGFHGGGEVDDQRFWFELRMSVYNTGALPFNPGPDGLLIPLPVGFVGASVEESMSTTVKVDKKNGLIYTAPIPPGQQNFNVSFALPVDDGNVSFNMPLPLGLASSSIMLGHSPGMRFAGIPASVKPEGRELNGKTYMRYGDLNIAANKALAFQMHGLPQPPQWQFLMKVVVGIAVVGFLAWIGFGIAHRGSVIAVAGSPQLSTLHNKRERLLSSLVDLEENKRNGKIASDAYDKERGKLMVQLEKVWEELGDDRRPPSAAH